MAEYTVITAGAVLVKPTGASRLYGLDVTEVLNDETLASVDSIDFSVVSQDTDEDGGVLTHSTAGACTISGNVILFNVAGGYLGAEYLLHIVFAFASGGKDGGTIRVKIRNK